MNKNIYENRRERLRGLMRKDGVEALLVQLAANRYYLSGFELHDPQPNESAGWLVVMDDGRDWLCTDARYLDAAKRLWDEERIFIYHGGASEQVGAMLKSQVKRLGFDARHMTLDAYEWFDAALELKRADGLVEALRVVKDDRELGLMKASCDINHKLMAWLPDTLKPGKTEKAVAWEIEQFFRNNGAEGEAFAGIVAVNANAALPHAIPGEDIILENSSVLVDVGCRYGGYCSDQTRTFWVGDKQPDAEFFRNLEEVKKAQAKAIEVIRPGVKSADVYAAARKSLESAGIARYFTHGLGHGVGLETHEAPSLGPSRDTVLKPGMVITVEPGVYYAGKFGIRWEYMVVVTEYGCKIL